MVTAVLFSLCLVAGVGYFIHQCWGRFNLLRAATGDFSLDRIPERVRSVLTIAFGQKKFIRPQVSWVRERLAGWLHFFVFWGFTILGLQIITMFGRAYGDHFTPLPWFVMRPYMLVRDFFEATVFVCVLILIARWAIIRPMRLIGFAPAENRQRSHPHWEAYFILACIGVIAGGGLVYDGARLVAHAGDPILAGDAAWEPISALVGRALIGIGPESAARLGSVAREQHDLAGPEVAHGLVAEVGQRAGLRGDGKPIVAVADRSALFPFTANFREKRFTQSKPRFHVAAIMETIFLQEIDRQPAEIEDEAMIVERLLRRSTVRKDLVMNLLIEQ
jgi:hypothetical protein